MDNILTISESRLFALPFEKDTLKLTLRTLNSHSNFRHSEILISAYQIRNISFDNEFLILGILFHFEKEERVYLKATSTHLLVSCSMDTDIGYLSRYAYFTIFRMMSIDIYFDFEKYYWPDFFDANTGESRFLEIINDRKGLDIYLKEEYSYFIKPNEKLFEPTFEPRIKRNRSVKSIGKATDKLSENVIGFCLADTFLHSWHSNHFPFLLPYVGKLTADKKKIKSFIGYVDLDKDYSEYSPTQSAIRHISDKMRSLAEIVGRDSNSGQLLVKNLDNENLDRFRQLLVLWQEAIVFLPHLTNIYRIQTLGLRNLKKRPKKLGMVICEFLEETPEICFLWKEHEDYYELSYRFRIGEELFSAAEKYTAFLISSAENPLRYYLFDRLADCLITLFFGEKRFKIQILKAHYGYFKDYLDMLRTHFEIKDI